MEIMCCCLVDVENVCFHGNAWYHVLFTCSSVQRFNVDSFVGDMPSPEVYLMCEVPDSCILEPMTIATLL